MRAVSEDELIQRFSQEIVSKIKKAEEGWLVYISKDVVHTTNESDFEFGKVEGEHSEHQEIPERTKRMVMYSRGSNSYPRWTLIIRDENGKFFETTCTKKEVVCANFEMMPSTKHMRGRRPKWTKSIQKYTFTYTVGQDDKEQYFDWFKNLQSGVLENPIHILFDDYSIIKLLDAEETTNQGETARI